MGPESIMIALGVIAEMIMWILVKLELYFLREQILGLNYPVEELDLGTTMSMKKFKNLNGV